MMMMKLHLLLAILVFFNYKKWAIKKTYMRFFKRKMSTFALCILMRYQVGSMFPLLMNLWRPLSNSKNIFFILLHRGLEI
ncbi:hypothetical protein L1987_10178 [Smallanthus sonchifolius]|uniref:Uncharacterized protein n=1 Tax=Smallanthus sonchifolius TaxID=185202 RepID=A0ACB9JRD8_9ASTR|nr:hypothetical protein L1987_10178 [Smallanthus sonchifolius]